MANGTNWSGKKNAYYQQWRQKQKQQNQPPQPPQPTAQPQQTLAQKISAQYAAKKNKQGNGSLQGDYSPGYTGNNNPQVLKWQGQTDEDKATKFLAKVHNTDMSQFDDNGYPYYPGDYQKFTATLGMNAKPTVLPDAEFDKMVQQHGLQVLYRGESGQKACDRFMFADNTHTGIGSYGDGFYFTEDVYTANKYAASKGGPDGRVIKMALSPNAHCITYNDLVKQMAKEGYKLKSALHKQGVADKTHYLNDGESQWAIKNGYNVITDCMYHGSQYHLYLSRDAVICSDKVKHKW